MIETKDLAKAKHVSAVLEYDVDGMIKSTHGALRAIRRTKLLSVVSLFSIAVYNLSLVLNPLESSFEPWRTSFFFAFAFFGFMFIYFSSKGRLTGGLLVAYMELLRLVENEDVDHHSRHIALTRLQIENEGNADGVKEEMKSVGDLFIYSYNLVEHLRMVKTESLVGLIFGMPFLIYYFIYHLL